MKTIIDKLNECVGKNPYFLDENGEVIKEKVKTSAINMDEVLIDILLNDDELKNSFFYQKNGILVFDKVKFSWIISNSGFLPDSYTSYKNKIGLIDSNGDFLKYKDDVTLSFPYKDCVLEFDSTDENEHRDEIFLNEVLSKDKIDVLLQPKAFGNSHKYISTKVNLFDNNDSDSDNLIIKGNNLIVLNSLLSKYSKQIKMMYWDILYNTSSDSVPYNDSFKHSSWLTMMKNRLAVAKDLLSESGIIMIHLDANEMAYLKVLMDEIFDRSNYLGMFTCKVKAPSGVASGAQMIFDCSEYILVYAKDSSRTIFNHLQEEAEIVNENSKTASFYKYILDDVSYDNMELVKDLGEEKIYRIKKDDFKIRTMDNFSAESYYNNYKKVFRTAALSGGREKEVAKIVSSQSDALESLFVFEHTPNKGKRAGQVCRDLIYKNGGVLMLSDFCKVDDKKKQIIKLQHITSILSNDWWQGISKEGAVTLNNGKKPELLLKTLIEMGTNKGDIVLDAYFGTGTTGAVALKLERKFIGIEQLDSHFEKAISRLENVINGDQSGISKEVGWTGGGSFTSCELIQDNARFVKEIEKAERKEELLDIYDRLLSNPSVLNYNIKIDEAKSLREIEFEKLDLDLEKKILLALLDKNSLYINKVDIEDKEKGISEDDIQFTKSFYGD